MSTRRASPAELDRQRRELLGRLLRAADATAPDTDRILPSRDRGPYPLSFAQQRLWFLEQLSPGHPFYNVQVSLRHRGPLDLDILEQAVEAIVERHQVLRTVFQLVDGQPLQIVSPNLHVPVAAVDLSRLPPSAREQEAIRIAIEERERPYRLDEGPLARLKVVRLGERDHVLLLGLHHIVADGWSMGVLAGELGVVYEGVRSGRGSGLSPLPVQYADFAVWQREWLVGERLAEQLGYWRGQLAGLSGLGLPLDRPRPAVQAHRGAGFGFDVSSGVVGGLTALARECQATLFMVLVAGFSVVLGRWCGQDDVVVGAPTAGRTRAELEGLIGFFVNTLVLRVDLSGDPSLRELVGRVREVALGAYAHADVPFEKLVEELAPQRDLSRNPLFQVTFQLFESPSAPDAVGVEAGLDVPVTSSLFDLRVDVWPAGSGLAGRVEFDTDLFDRVSIEWLVERFGCVLEQLASTPQRRLGEVWLVPETQQALLERVNQTAAAIPPGCVQDAVAARAAETPDAVAVGDQDGVWSYAELDQHANGLAQRLVELGVEPGGLVAVLVERGRRFTAAALGVLKAGCAYLPLDPAYPPARLDRVLEDATPAVLVTTREIAVQLAPATTIETLLIDPWPATADTPPARSGSPDDAAYVIYTSGSTGTPKGVVCQQRALMNLVGWHQTTYTITADDRGSQIASVGFDAAVWELWPYLTAGASVHTCNDTTRADADALLRWLDRHQITIAFIPTPLTELLLHRPWPASSRLRYLLTGGDTLRHWANPDHPYQLVNHYGPTESTVVTTATPIPPNPTNTHLPPIGTPIANTTCYIVDHHHTPAPPGTPGELWIGGESLAHSYHNDPTLTHTRFIENPFHPHPPRLYQTGDLVRLNADHTISFLGRTDNQIKIRGYRIEPREIETLLHQHPHITHAIITTHHNPTPHLTAHITTHGVRDDERRHQVRHWQTLYDGLYRAEDGADAEFDLRGWNSSYDGSPLGEAAMREQVDQTVARVAALQPRRILEIGCGTGLLLFRLAEGCERYCATDFSAGALAGLREPIARHGWHHVELLECEAHEAPEQAGGDFDLVLLNSVVQYFPDAAYLEQVLEAAAGCLRPGGSIVVGDVRNLALLEAFHTTVELANAADDVPAAEMRQHVRRGVEAEQELLLDPAWFARFAARTGGTLAVVATPRRGRRQNELTSFRYDVTLTAAAAAEPPPAIEWLDWERDGLDLGALAGRLGVTEGAIGVRGIPSARLAFSVRACRELAEPSADVSAGDLRASAAAGEAGVDPEDLWALAGERAIEIGWSGSGATGRYDLVASPRGAAPLPPPVATSTDGRLSNDPLRHGNLMVAEIRAWLQAQLPEQMVPSAIVVHDELPLTANGKIDVAALAPPDAPRRNAAARPATRQTEQRLAELWAQTLGVEGVGLDDNFFELGGDSILSIKLASRASDAGIYFTPKQLFQAQTVAELAPVVSSTPHVEPEQGAIVGPVPLTPIQRWFFEQRYAEAHHFNQAALLAVPAGVDAAQLVRALHAVVEHHDALHLRFHETATGWQQHSDPPERELAVASADLSAIGADAIPAALERAGDRLQATLSLDGPLLRVAVLNLGAARPRRLLIAIHHLAVDGVSWSILVEDLWRAYGQLAQGLPVSLPPKTSSFRDWSRRLSDRAAAPATAAQAGFWLDQLAAVHPLPRDLPGDDNTVAVTRTVRVELTSDETSDLLRRLLAQHHVEINAVLLYALARALQAWTNRAEIAVAVEGHGREPLFDDIDLSRTVGWFTSMFPVALRLPADDDPAAGLGALAAQLAALPDGGVGYGLLRYLSHEEEVRRRLASEPWPELSFNYLGQLEEGAADPLAERTGNVRSPAGTRSHLLEVNGAVRGGRLTFDLYYSSSIHRESTIHALAEAFARELRRLLDTIGPHVAGPAAGGPSDRDVAALLARLADGGAA